MRASSPADEDWGMTTTCTETRPSAPSSSTRRTDRQVHAEIERRLEAHLLIARRIRTAR